MAQLPELKRLSTKKIALQTALEPRSAIAESIRSLRTSFQFSTKNGTPKSIFITSSGPSEGKTTLALNLAIAYAQTGKKVLLIDADLRNPSIHRLLELDNKEGLTSFLADPEGVENVVSTDTVENTDISRSCMIKHLNVISSGPIPSDPVELLSSTKLVTLLKNAEETFDQIIIDGPPVLGLADALILSSLAEGTVLTVEAGKTKKTSLQDSMKRLKRTDAYIMGTILTKMNNKVNPGYSDQYYSYSSSS